MCTLSYIPKGKGSFVLTSNRDERKDRPTSVPQAYNFGDQELYFPKDLEAGGTWIAASNKGKICCLLNGAFEAHKRKPPYIKSRGQLLLEVLIQDDVLDYFKQMDLEGIEPFTLVCISQVTKFYLLEMRWDGSQKHYKILDIDHAHIWSSAALYPKEIRQSRQEWFQKWMENGALTDAAGILKFHTTNHGDDVANDLVMERWGILKTVSITQIVATTRSFSMEYYDLLDGEKSNVTVLL